MAAIIVDYIFFVLIFYNSEHIPKSTTVKSCFSWRAEKADAKCLINGFRKTCFVYKMVIVIDISPLCLISHKYGRTPRFTGLGYFIHISKVFQEGNAFRT
ncbi:Uncharacterised protein r2_g1878 [Pycnogonum litorale]